VPRGSSTGVAAADPPTRPWTAPVETNGLPRSSRSRGAAREPSLLRLLGAGLGVGKRALPPPLRERLTRAEAQYRPRPLTVPARYLHEQEPSPAPTISVVTPTGGAVPYLRQTIESVLRQGYPGLEYTVTHDGTNRGAADTVAAYERRLRQLEVRPDRGQPNAIAEGFARSEGEIMGWLNSDDVLLPGALACVGRYMAENPGVDVVYGYRVLLDADDRDVGIWVTAPHCASSLQWYDFVPQETVFWRRSLWERVGGIDERLTLAFDWDLFSRFHRSGAKIVRLPRFLGGYRQHPAQRSRVEYRRSLREQGAVRRQWHARAVHRDEVRARVFPMVMRTLPYYVWHLVRSRVSVGRVEVSFRPTVAESSNGSRPGAPWTE
jgi:GT2 family glycosyltransferase